jgi:cell division protein FtsX
MKAFRRIFRRNQELVKSVRPSDLPESFRVDLRQRGEAKAFARRMQGLAGVESAETATRHSERDLLATIRRCQEGDEDLEVFMDIHATQDQIDGAVAAVSSEPGLSVVKVLSKDDAFAEFQRIFASKPKLRNAVTPVDLPVSIRVHASGPVAPAVIDRLEAVAGVETVGHPAEVCAPIRNLLARGLTPEQLAKLMLSQLAGMAT